MFRHHLVCTVCLCPIKRIVDGQVLKCVKKANYFFDMVVENNYMYAVLFSGLVLNRRALQNFIRIAGAKVRTTKDSFVYFSLQNH